MVSVLQKGSSYQFRASICFESKKSQDSKKVADCSFNVVFFFVNVDVLLHRILFKY